MSGKIIVLFLALAAAGTAAAGYYLQVYAFYHEVAPAGPLDVQATAIGATTPEPLPHTQFQAIDARSSPIRYRACFRTALPLARALATYQPYAGAEPLIAPPWFECFDARRLTTDLREGRAKAFLGQREIARGVDRVLVLYGDGRGFVWHQLNGTFQP
ncbi:MAG: histidine kinase [Rhodobacteraceae bacterium]|nr:histidine kinase [Paracoccaceae bacterium]